METILLYSKKCLFLALVLLFFGQTGKAQNQTNLSQYMLYQPFLNPSSIGTYEGLNAGLIHRNQWSGFDGAPKTSIVGVNSKIGKTNLFTGLGFQHEQIGVLQSNQVYANFAYRAKLKQKHYLSIGLSMGADMFNLNYQDLKNSYYDPELNYGVKTQTITSPIAKFGLYYFTSNFYVTAYIPNLLKAEVKENGGKITANTVVDPSNFHYYVQGGYSHSLTKNVTTNFSTLLKKSSTFQYDLNLQFVFNDIIGLGGAYRSSKEIVGMVSLKFFKSLTLGYGYDYALSDLSSVSNGSHEVIVTYNLFQQKLNSVIQIPRF